MSDKKLTPLMRQYWDIKNNHLDKVLLFRMGDFFEMFHEDAIIAAPILGIALTKRNKKSKDDTPMCGVPHHSIAGKIAMLLSAGHKVAICDQIEDPALAQGLVKRAVTRILSPGMVYDPETLDEQSANYICSFDNNSIGFLDTSTGVGFYYKIEGFAQAYELINILNPVELVVTPEVRKSIQKESLKLHLTTHSLTQCNLPSKDLPKAMVCLLDYAVFMQGAGVLTTLRPVEKRVLSTGMQVSATVLRHLEVFQTYKGETRGSLFFAINRTKTSAGARLLKNYLSFPFSDEPEISKRLDQVEYWVNSSARLKVFRRMLSNIGDIERRLSKITSSNCHAKDLLSLGESLEAGLSATEFYKPKFLKEEGLLGVQSVIESIQRTIDLEAPINFKSGGIINKGFMPALDELIELSENSKTLLIQMEQDEREKTSIPSLKIKYNNVFGYFIEVTNIHKHKVPDNYKRKQTLSNAERYITQELHELEGKVLSAKSKRIELELELFNDLKTQVLKSTQSLLSAARLWSDWDVFSSLAWLSIEYNYCRPEFSINGDLKISSSRHPVVEQEVRRPFVPNDIEIKKGQCLLLTGPNMAGKSTIMRQVAVTALLAQMGSFVPARHAELPVFDKLFTRIGASDFLNEGLSTFMVEMQEAAHMVKQSTSSSLLVLDEIGRGTSTYDGMSLAQSLLEYLISKKGCMTFFATHYHELTSLEARFSQIKNAHMTIKENKGDLLFLHTLEPGPANKSYGVQVARLAGLPLEITKRAQNLQTTREAFDSPASGQMTLMGATLGTSEDSVLEPESEELLEQIKSTSIQSITPIEALNKIAAWQQKLI